MKEPKRKTWAEYKREARKRERERKRDQPEAIRTYISRPFFEFFQEDDGELEFYADVMGKEWWKFTDDRGIETLSGEALIEEDMAKASDSLGRAEMILSCLIDSAADLARIISLFKQKEIKKQIDALEKTDFADPKAKAQSAVEAARLKKMLNQLNRQVRWSFPQWKVAGE